jgi:hypothetical protein
MTEVPLSGGAVAQCGYSFSLGSYFVAAFDADGVFLPSESVGGFEGVPLESPSALCAALSAEGSRLRVAPDGELWRALQSVHARISSAA